MYAYVHNLYKWPVKVYQTVKVWWSQQHRIEVYVNEESACNSLPL